MHQTVRRVALLFCFTLSLAVLSNLAEAQTITVLHNFTGGNDGAFPDSGLTMDGAGNFYGTANRGGASDVGTVFRLSHAGSGWVLTTLYSFKNDRADGANPYGGVVFGPDGSLYGTTYFGGQYRSGTVYRLRPSPVACHSVICPWEETVLYAFTGNEDGANPAYGNLLFDQAGNIYGTTKYGGFGDGGVVFELTPSNGGWTESVLWSFIQETGFNPASGLIFDSSGNLYGTTGLGDGAAGVVYQLSPSGSGWNYNVLASIQFTDSITCGGVVMDGQGNLYGTSSCGAGAGGIYELTPSNGGWTFNVLYAYSGDVSGPFDTPTLDAAGNVYGTSYGTGLREQGEVFELTPSNGGWTYTSVKFNGSNGQWPVGGVILDAAGNIYGTASGGGANDDGVVWAITP